MVDLCSKSEESQLQLAIQGVAKKIALHIVTDSGDRRIRPLSTNPVDKTYDEIWKIYTIARYQCRKVYLIRHAYIDIMRPQDFLTHDEFAKLKAACQDDREKAIVLTLAGTGIRVNELVT